MNIFGKNTGTPSYTPKDEKKPDGTPPLPETPEPSDLPEKPDCEIPDLKTIPEPTPLEMQFSDFEDFPQDINDDDRLEVFLYRLKPVDPEYGSNVLIDKFLYPIDLNFIKRNFGGGKYKILVKINGKLEHSKTFGIEGNPIYKMRRVSESEPEKANHDQPDDKLLGLLELFQTEIVNLKTKIAELEKEPAPTDQEIVMIRKMKMYKEIFSSPPAVPQGDNPVDVMGMFNNVMTIMRESVNMGSELKGAADQEKSESNPIVNKIIESATNAIVNKVLENVNLEDIDISEFLGKEPVQNAEVINETPEVN